MRLWGVVVLTLLGVAAGAGLGFVAGFSATVFGRISTGLDVACVLLQKAETGHYITRDQRLRLVDAVMPQLTKPDAQPDAGPAGWVQGWAQQWAEGSRNHVKSGCPDA